MEKVQRRPAEAEKRSGPLWMNIASKAMIFWAEHLMITEIIGIENLNEAANHVNNNEGGLIVTPNHNSYIDAEIMKKVRDKIKPIKKFSILWANKFTGKDGGLYKGENLKKVGLVGQIGKKMAELVNVKLVDVPQDATSIPEALKALRIIKSERDEILGSNNVLGVFPEGTRSRNGTLGEARSALTVLFDDPELNSKTLVLPIAATGTDKILSPDNKKINPFAKVTIIFGKPYKYAQIQEEIKTYRPYLEPIINKQENIGTSKKMNNLLTTIFMMWHIGQLLPKEKWGAYKEFFTAIQTAKKIHKLT